jgi:hypothetical protein
MAARAGTGPALAMVNAAAGKRWRVTAAARPAPPPPLPHRRLLSGVGPAERVMRAAIRLGTYRAARSR